MSNFHDLPVIFGKEPEYWDETTASYSFAVYEKDGKGPPIGRIIFRAESLISIGKEAQARFPFLTDKKEPAS